MAVFRRHDVAETFMNNRELQQFILTDVTLTGRTLGTGSYGSVEEVMYQHTICAGKRIHEALIEVENEGVAEMVQKYLQECQLMSSLRHPNITQFLGLCFLPGSQLPLLVMERLETSLDDLLEHMPNLPLSLKRSVLEDVASGLLYLHKRPSPVIHRDLTAKNVLLTYYLVAKITDMGNSRIIDMSPSQMNKRLSNFPGTLVYMPPEALDNTHRYGPSLDIFSFGHLALFTIIQKFPGDLVSCPNNVLHFSVRTELERRGKYIDVMESLINPLHPNLVQLVKQCLHNVPSQRPSTDELLARLQRMKVEVEGEYGGSPIRLDMVRLRLAKELKTKDRTIEDQTRELEVRDRHVQELQAEIQAKDQQITTKDREIVANSGRARHLQKEVRVKDEQLQRQETTIQTLTTQMKELQADTQLQETGLREELQSKEAEISKLREEQKKCQGLQQEGVPLKLPLQLSWRRGPDMPFKMDSYIQSVVIGRTVYVGGGDAGLGSSANENMVMAYDTISKKWTTLTKEYTAYRFAMTTINDQLVLVGGWEYGRASKVLGVWRDNSEVWTHPYPEMLTACYDCSAVVYNEWLVVAGGKKGNRERDSLSTVQVMNISNKQWYAGPPTPIAWHSMKTVTICNTCYFMGDNNVYSLSLPALLSWLKLKSHKDNQIWKEIRKLSTTWSTPLSISGSLLAIGGVNKDRKAVTTIHLYLTDTEEWVKVGDLPTPRHDCTCIMVTERELLVFGGNDAGLLKRMDIALISA